jgi:SAM-dependent methyltransferase
VIQTKEISSPRSRRHWKWDLCCPACKSQLETDSAVLRCTNQMCNRVFPTVGNIPIVIDESKSVFRIQEIIRGESYFVKRPQWMQRLKAVFPKPVWQPQSARNYQRLSELLSARDRPRVLVVGGGTRGEGLERLMDTESIEVIETDVGLNGMTALVCDGHDVPFPDEYFDAVVLQVVLEHVIDPYRCVSEAHRVLKSNGFVYAETPFMQQVHGGRYDFLRFTDLGHRRLFRAFTEVASGAIGGPATALAWAYEYFLISFSRRQWTKALLKAFARFSSFWLKYFDYVLISRPGGLDAASAYYFLGQKSDELLSDHDLLNMYRGLC